MCLYGGVEKFERIKTKRVTSDTKNLIRDEILVSVQLKKISRQWSSPQFWSGEALCNSKCLILYQNLQLLEEDGHERNLSVYNLFFLLLICF